MEREKCSQAETDDYDDDGPAAFGILELTPMISLQMPTANT